MVPGTPCLAPSCGDVAHKQRNQDISKCQRKPELLCMGRRSRTIIPGLPFHVYQRAINGQACYFDSQDRQRFLRLLEEAVGHHGCAIHAYVLMTNHFHLLLTPAKSSSLPSAAHSVKSRYARYINWKYERTGPLWEGRYKAAPIDSDRYLFTCQRYIELNPVRAGLVSHPREYPWSSYRCNVGRTSDRLIRPHELYDRLGRTLSGRQSAYGNLFAEVLPAGDKRKLEAMLRDG